LRLFWPPAEPAQADYERLRAAVCAGMTLSDHVSLRFARGGLAALIARPAAEPVFQGVLLGARRPPWTPHADPRVDALVSGYRLLLDNADGRHESLTAGEVGR